MLLVVLITLAYKFIVCINHSELTTLKAKLNVYLTATIHACQASKVYRKAKRCAMMTIINILKCDALDVIHLLRHVEDKVHVVATKCLCVATLELRDLWK